MLSIEASFAAHIEKDVWNFTLMGEKGGASWDPCVIFKDEHGYMFNETPAYVGSDNIFDAKMKHFVDVCRDGATSISTGEHGLAVQKMLNGVYDSAAKGGEVALAGAPPVGRDGADQARCTSAASPVARSGHGLRA